MTSPTLAEIQTWFQHINTRLPDRSGQREFSGWEIDDVLDDSGPLNAQHGTAIYGNGYTARLLGCLAAEFPTLRQAFSTEWFDHVAQQYLSRYPPTEPSLTTLGSRFPAFLQEELSATSPTADDTAGQFIVDLARLERAISETSRGQGTENIDHLAFAHWGSIIPSSVYLAPNLRLLKLRSNIVPFLHAMSNRQNPSFPESCEKYVVVCRRNFQVCLDPVEWWQYELLQHLKQSPIVQPLPTILASSEMAARIPVWLLLSTERGYILDRPLRALQQSNH